jgi:transposase
VSDLGAWLRQNRSRLSSKAATAKAIDYVLKRWTSFTRFLEDGRILTASESRGMGAGARR